MATGEFLNIYVIHSFQMQIIIQLIFFWQGGLHSVNLACTIKDMRSLLILNRFNGVLVIV